MTGRVWTLRDTPCRERLVAIALARCAAASITKRSSAWGSRRVPWKRGCALVLQLLSDESTPEAVDVWEKHAAPTVVGSSERVAQLLFYVRRYNDRAER
jgi:hypothetical protein